MPVDKTILNTLCQAAGQGCYELLLKNRLRNHAGYAVIMFDLKGGSVSYNSNGKQEDMIKLLREIADSLAQSSSQGRKIVFN